MRIFNAMFGCELGGIEQAFVDYCEALIGQGHQVTALIHPDAKVTPALTAQQIVIRRVANMGQWDPFAIARLRKIIFAVGQPDVILAHGNRAYRLIKKAVEGKIPVVAVAHNYNIKHFIGADAVVAINREICEKLVQRGQLKETVFYLPNMISIPKDFDASMASGLRHNPPVIGTMGRFVRKKGFNVFIDAVSILRSRGIVFKAVIGGEGDEEDELKRYAIQQGVQDVVDFPGWISRKAKFFNDIDIFCLPSLHEPFGIILLEAFKHKKPVVTTASEGPIEIARHNEDALMVPVGDAEAMAAALEQLILNPHFAQHIAEKGGQKVRDVYAMDKVGRKLSDLLNHVVRVDAELRRNAMLNPLRELGSLRA